MPDAVVCTALLGIEHHIAGCLLHSCIYPPSSPARGSKCTTFANLVLLSYTCLQYVDPARGMFTLGLAMHHWPAASSASHETVLPSTLKTEGCGRKLEGKQANGEAYSNHSQAWMTSHR